jgi:hypothetical protein
MKNIILSFLLFVAAVEVTVLFFINRQKPNDRVLAEITVSTPTPTITPTETPTMTPTPTPSPIITPKPTPVKTPTPVPQPKYSSEEINEFINRFSSQYSVDPNVIRHIALCESGFNPSAIHLSYYGLFQFGPTTWKNIRKEFGEDTNTDLRLNAEEAVQTAAYAVSVGKKGIWPNCYP